MSVSAQHVEIVRRVYEAIAARDAAAVYALYDPDVEIDSSRLPENSLMARDPIVRGHEGLKNLTNEWSEAWSSFEDHCDELIDAGDYVVSIVTRRGRGRASGVETTTTRAGVWTVRDARIVRVVWFASVEDALEAAGVRR